jgi:hypothetical protein
MKKEWLIKSLALVIVVLFIGVSFQPIIAKDTILPEKKSDSKELLETIFDIANNKDIQSIIQKYETKNSLLGFQHLQVNLQKEIIDVIVKNDEFNKIIKQLLELPCECENNNTNRWSFPVICKLLLPLLNIGWLLSWFSFPLLLYILRAIGKALNCFWFVPTPP